ncbi:hypothetical protein JCM10207_000087 [Rhodosporidiobolus poonsookiae]
MPYLRLPTANPVELFYETFPPKPASTSSARPTPAPSLLLLSPLCLNNTFLTPYVERFTEEGYAVTALELRSHGRSKNGPTAAFDGWTLAADVAVVMHALQLPPSHIFGSGCSAFQTALKLAVLFPPLVLSLSIAGTATLFAQPRSLDAFKEVTAKWVQPDDEEEWVDVLGGVGEFMLGERKYDDANEIWDRVLGSVARSHNPYKAHNIFIVAAPHQRPPGMTPQMLASIEQPIQLFQGDNDFCYGLEAVREQNVHFSGAKELDFHGVEDGPHVLTLTHSAFILSQLAPFLQRHTPAQSPAFIPPDFPAALAQLSTFPLLFCDPTDLSSPPYIAASSFASSIAARSPSDPDSFSLTTPEEVAGITPMLEGMLLVERECELDLPMCFEKDDWEIEEEAERLSGMSDEEQKDDRWTWSNRETYPWPSASSLLRPRLSLSNSVHSHSISTTTTTTMSDPQGGALSILSHEEDGARIAAEARTSPRFEASWVTGGGPEVSVSPFGETESTVSTGPATRVN